MYIAVELVQGKTLEQRIQCAKQNAFKPGQVDMSIREATSALAHLAEQKIWHEDVRPQNMVCTQCKPDGMFSIKICDPVYSERDSHSRATYMSPEARNRSSTEGESDGSFDREKSDMFSAGLTFLRMATLLEIENVNKKME